MATELAKAYVQIIPSARGIKGKIAEQMGGEADSAGKLFGGKMMGAIKSVIAAAAIGKAISASINEGAALQQSLGGIETLFKESADKVKTNAAKAFQTAGMSANEYMEMTTGFAASLLSSLGNDTEKAADIADMAMVDMSDNANKMGTSMDLIQNAYQGFAKQNYTMLDNLKLGYGGTKTEMERLLADAQKITGIKYDINNLSDVYSAIHVIQGELGITGTTAKEAAETFTGSFAAMKASAKNFIGNLSIGQDIKGPLLALLETTKTFFVGNFLPMIGDIVKGIPETIMVAAPIIAEAIGGLFTSSLDKIIETLPLLMEMGGELITNMVNGISLKAPEMVTETGNVINSFLEKISQMLPIIFESGAGILTSVINGILSIIPVMVTETGNVINSFLEKISQMLPIIFESGVGIVTNVINGILSMIPELIAASGNAVNSFVDKILKMLPVVLQSGVEMLMNVANGIINNMPQIISSASQVISNFIDVIKQNLPNILQKGVEILLNVVNGIINNIPQVISSASQIISNFINEVFRNLPWILETGITLLGQLAAGIVNAIPNLVAQIPAVISGIISVFTNTDWLSVGVNIISGIASGLANAGYMLWNAVIGVLGSFKDKVLSFFGIHSPSRWGVWVGEMLDKGFANGIAGNIGMVEKSVNLVEGTMTKPFESDIKYTGSAREASGETAEELLKKILVLLEMIVNKDTEVKIYFKDREVARTLKEIGVAFA